MTHIGFGDLINVHRDQEVAGKLGPWMWAYRDVCGWVARSLEKKPGMVKYDSK